MTRAIALATLALIGFGVALGSSELPPYLQTNQRQPCNNASPFTTSTAAVRF